MTKRVMNRAQTIKVFRVLQGMDTNNLNLFDICRQVKARTEVEVSQSAMYHLLRDAGLPVPVKRHATAGGAKGVNRLIVLARLVKELYRLLDLPEPEELAGLIGKKMLPAEPDANGQPAESLEPQNKALKVPINPS